MSASAGTSMTAAVGSRARLGHEKRQLTAFFLGRIAGDFGDMLVPVALVAAAVHFGGAQALGWILAFRAFPSVASALLGGAWADGRDPRRLMIFSDVVRLGAQVTMAILLAVDVGLLWPALIAQAMYGAASGMFGPAAGVLLPALVPESELQRTNARLSVLRSSARILGPVVAAGVLAGADVWILFAADALTFAVSAVALLVVTRQDRGHVVASGRLALTQTLRDIASGVRAARRASWLLVCIGYFAAFQFFAVAPLFVLGPFLISDEGSESAAWGAFLTAGGIGWVLGGLVAGRLRPRRPLVMCLWLSLLDGAQLIALALGAPVPILLGVGAAAGAVAAIWDIMWVTAVQTHVERRFLGRVWALDEFGSAIAAPVAFAAIGLAATAMDAASLAWIAGALATVATVVAVSFPAVRNVGGSPHQRTPLKTTK